MKSRLFATDCRHFRPDSPCRFHKESGKVCVCEHYDQTDMSILVVKLDAVGDVLRTTALLPALRRKFPRASVTWLTRRAAIPLLENNRLIDRSIAVEDPETQIEIAATLYDLILSPDASLLSSQLAKLAAKEQSEVSGFRFDGRAVVPTNEAAREWMQLGTDDSLKKANRRTYHDFIGKITGLDSASLPLYFPRDDERRRTREFRNREFGDRIVVCLNLGSGLRWPMKRWPAGYFLTVARNLRDAGIGCLVVAGPDESDLLAEFPSTGAKIFYPQPSVREFAVALDASDIVVTADTLPMHLAIALRKRTIALFGPTSMSEIEIVEGEKIGEAIECHTCYRKTCDIVDHCMLRIAPTTVWAALSRQIDAHRGTMRERL